MAENIRKLGNILFDSVKHTGEQVAQVVREHLLRIDICLDAQCFHLPPDIRAADGFACAGHKNHTALDILLCCVAEQFFPQFPHDKHGSCLTLAAHHRLTAFGRFHGDELQFADPDAGTANGLQDEIQPFVVPALRRLAKSGVLRFRQLLFFGAVDLLLQLQGFYPQIVPTKKGKQAIY